MPKILFPRGWACLEASNRVRATDRVPAGIVGLEELPGEGSPRADLRGRRAHCIQDPLAMEFSAGDRQPEAHLRGAAGREYRIEVGDRSQQPEPTGADDTIAIVERKLTPPIRRFGDVSDTAGALGVVPDRQFS